MANSENAKLKILILYDYFRKHVNAYNNDRLKMSDILGYLKTITGEDFERKSIYADIKRLNDYVRKQGEVKQEDEWITLDGNRYIRSELNDELTPDEVKLIVDAISTTSFVDSGICGKVEKLFPAYFSNYHPLVSHGKKGGITQKTRNQLNLIRNCINDHTSIKFTYGYLVAGGFRGTHEVAVSPLELDWEKNCYYLIAVNNREYELTKDYKASIRKYRLDRIVNVNVNPKDQYVKSTEKNAIKSYLEHTVNAFSCYEYKNVDITLKFFTANDCLRAYSALSDEVEIIRVLNDNIEKGEVSVTIKAPLIGREDKTDFVPTLYPILYMLFTFPNRIAIEIGDEELKAEFKRQLTSSLKGLT